MNQLTWYENYDGHGNFIAHQIEASSAGPSVAGDLDGDGDVDLVNANGRWYENDGQGRFASQALAKDAINFAKVMTFDLAGDGDLDIVGFAQSTAHLYENVDGMGTFVDAAIYELPENAVDASDFDLDGHLDILALEHRNLSQELDIDPTPRDVDIRILWLYRATENGQLDRQRMLAEGVSAEDFPNEGPGTAEWSQFPLEVADRGGAQRAEFADVDGDGDPDVVMMSYGDPEIRTWTWHENAEGVLLAAADIGHTRYGDLYLRDIDRDGDLDGFAVDTESQTVGWQLNDDGSFTDAHHVAFPFENLGRDITDVADINGDGSFDVITGFRDDVPTWFDGTTWVTHQNLASSASFKAIDKLQAALRGDVIVDGLDHNADGRVNSQDLDYLVKAVIGTTFGDANLDGTFDSSDLVQVFRTGEYHDEIQGNSNWADGDWDGDGDFTSGDLVQAFTQGDFFTPSSGGTLFALGRSEVLAFDHVGRFLGVFADVLQPAGIAVASNGDVFVSNVTLSRGEFTGITRYDRSGNIVARIPSLSTELLLDANEEILYALSPGTIQEFDVRASQVISRRAARLTVNDTVGMAFAPDGTLYVSSRDGIERFDVTTGERIGNVFHVTSPIDDIVFGPDGDLFVAHSVRGINRFDGDTGAFIETFARPSFRNVGVIEFGPDGNLFVGGSDVDDRIERFNGQTGQFIDTFVASGHVGIRHHYQFAFLPSS